MMPFVLTVAKAGKKSKAATTERDEIDREKVKPSVQMQNWHKCNALWGELDIVLAK